MHSSKLRDTDFVLTRDNTRASFTELLGDFQITRRVGVICPEPLDALGAATLLMTCVTAFYDGYRAAAEPFFAYPDFYTLQSRAPVADYGMFDIWPMHKNVLVEAEALTDAITDRAIDTLILPEDWAGVGDLHPVQQAALQRTLRCAFLYARSGSVDGAGSEDTADITIRCQREPIESWANRAINSISDHEPTQWAQPVAAQCLEQSFRQLAVADVLSRL